jgi:hypothetical protein
MIFSAVLLASCYFVIAQGNGINASKPEAFQKWFVNHGGIMKGIEIHSFPEMGNGFRTLQPVKENDLVMKIPISLIFSVENMKNHPNEVIRWFYSTFHSVSSEQALIAWLLYEKKLGSSSFFYEYLEILPEKIPTSLIYFNEEEINELQNSHFEEETRENQKEISDNYHRFLRIFSHLLKEKNVAMLNSLFLSFSVFTTLSSSSSVNLDTIFIAENIQQTISFDDYLWCLSILNSRALRFHGEPHLVPMSDIFNYQKHDKTRNADSGAFFLKYHQFDSTSLSVYADRTVDEVGKQLFEDYGDNTNEIYFQYHGFVPSVVNPFHCVSFSSIQAYFSKILVDMSPSMEASLNRDTMSVYEKVVPKEARDLFALLHFPPLAQLSPVCLKNDGKLPRQMIIVFTILSMNEEERAQCRQAVNNSEQAKMSSTGHHLNWKKIAEECYFDFSYEEYERSLEDAVIRVSSSSSSSSSNSPSSRKRKLMKEENEEDLSLAERTWKTLSSFLQSGISSLHYSSTVEDDRQLLLQYSQVKKSQQLEPISLEKIFRHEIAIKYRVINKLFYSHFCSLYELDCSTMYEHSSVSSASVSASSPSSSGRSDASKNQKSQRTADSSSSSFLSSERSATRESITTSQEDYDEQLRKKIDHFNEWFLSFSPQPCKIKAFLFPQFYRIGTIVTSPAIEKEELYLGVPPEVIMSAATAFRNDGISSLVSKLFEKYQRNDEFHELAFFLIYETFVKKEESKYYPYLTLLPTYTDMKERLPLFWTKEEVRSRLFPSHLVVEVLDYQYRVQRRYGFLSNITEITSFFAVGDSHQAAITAGDIEIDTVKKATGNHFSFENYLWATAILDSRSIWWNGQRHLVPMLDFINCKEGKEDRNRLHSTILDDSKRYAITYAGKRACFILSAFSFLILHSLCCYCYFLCLYLCFCLLVLLCGLFVYTSGLILYLLCGVR